MGKLTGKTAVVTGGNSGIGLATAKVFVDEGANVVLFGRDAATLDRAVTALGPAATGVKGDVTSGDDLERLFETVPSRAEFEQDLRARMAGARSRA